jgi:16S rRNA (cytosine1402-N4)-methyltransferase
MSEYHVPVMVQESIRLLNLKAGGIYVDATTGGGGHSLAMLKAVPGIRLFCFDQDEEALAEAEQTLNGYPGVELIQANFAAFRTELALRKIKGIDGILFDLGVSSHQLDCRERGFSFDRNAPLDMRMDQGKDYSAFNAVNELKEAELTVILREFGEEPAARKIARAIANAPKPLETTGDLARVIETVVGAGSKESLKTKVRVFQALRIQVNDELTSLSRGLTDAINLLFPEGRIVVLSYHSLEDRIVKQAFRLAEQQCICPPAIIKCVCDHRRQLKVLTRNPLTASEDELVLNPRSRSAKLRAAEKTGNEAGNNNRYPKRVKGQGEK